MCQKRPWWVEGAGHSDLIFSTDEDYMTKLRDFAASIRSPEPETQRVGTVAR